LYHSDRSNVFPCDARPNYGIGRLTTRRRTSWYGIGENINVANRGIRCWRPNARHTLDVATGIVIYTDSIRQAVPRSCTVAELEFACVYFNAHLAVAERWVCVRPVNGSTTTK
jgi:hypothetical protein